MRTTLSLDVPFRTQQYVVLAAQLGSFHKVARVFGVDHTVVTRAVARLEKQLGLKIFERSRSGFTVTKAGEVFLRELHSALDHVERACDLARYEGQLAQEPLRIGYSIYSHSRLVPVLERIRAAAPSGRRASTSTELQAGTMPQLMEALLRGELHAVFSEQPGFHEDLWMKPIAKEGFSLCISKSHRLARKPDVQIGQLEGELLFLMPRTASPELHDRTTQYIESTGAQPRIREVLSSAHAIEIVAHDLGSALLPRSVSRLSHPGVLYKPVTDKLLWIETFFCRRRDVNDDRIQTFLDTLLEQLSSLRITF